MRIKLHRYPTIDELQWPSQERQCSTEVGADRRHSMRAPSNGDSTSRTGE